MSGFSPIDTQQIVEAEADQFRSIEPYRIEKKCLIVPAFSIAPDGSRHHIFQKRKKRLPYGFRISKKTIRKIPQEAHR